MEINGNANVLNQSVGSEQTKLQREQSADASAVERQRRERELDAAQERQSESAQQQQVVSPSETTIQQIESSNSASTDNNQNFNGLGEVAVNRYQSLEKSEQAQELQNKIKVDITV